MTPLPRWVSRLQGVIIACTVATAALVLVGPWGAMRPTVIRIHYLGLATLAVFLTVGELCHLAIFRRVRAGLPWSCIAPAVRAWRALTALMPGAAALTILGSGLQLVRLGGYSLRATWLAVLVGGFGALFADGILGYTPAVAGLDVAGEDPALQARARQQVLSLRFNLPFLLHLLSLPLLLAVGRWKLLPSLAPWERCLAALDRFLLPATGALTGTATAVAAIGVEFLAVYLLRRRYTRTATATN
jgi:hypothetical protein